MGWKLTGHPKTQKVTKNLAEKFANMESIPGERPLSEVRLRVYEKIIKDEGFRPSEWVACFCRETGVTYRVNGQHTSVLMSGLDPLPELYVIISYYECDSLRDVSKLYSTFDSKVQSRNISDINRSFASCVPRLVGVDQRTLNLCAGALTYADVQDEYRRKFQPQERAEKLLEYSDFVIWVHNLVRSSNSTNSSLKRMAVFAAMFLCYRKHPNLATEFFTAVRDETGLTPECPDRKLGRYLLITSSVKSRRYGGYEHMRIPDREFFVKVLHAFNAWRKDEKTNMTYYKDKPIPQVV